MPLYSYRKAPVKMRPDVDSYAAQQAAIASKRKSITVGDVVVGAYNDFHKLMSTSKIAAMIVPFVLVITGVYIIYSQVWPTFVQTVQEASGYFNQGGASLVAGEYIQSKQQYSNPGAKYFADLKNSAQEQNLLFNDKKSLDYKGTFSISIPSLNLNDLKTTSNVDSSVEAVYDQQLGDGLAHFQGTSLPFSELNNYNVVVYGHSAPGDYYERTHDPAAAFSRLSQIRYGSEIIVKFEGKEYKYKFTKGKIVDADDLTILQGTKGQKQLTLFTCYPNGNNAKRFVAIARFVE